MKSLYFLLFIVLSSIVIGQQHDVKIELEKIGDGYEMYISNNEIYPVSLIVNFELTNLVRKDAENQVYTIQGKENRVLLTSLAIKNIKKEYGLKYTYSLNWGVHNNIAYDKDFEYYLPFQNTESYKVDQGYNGKISHFNENALDFSMPVGTKIMAARGGLVVKVIDINSKNCGSQDCAKYNNFITILHDDGTFAEYAHIKLNGAKVKVGDKVTQGQLIALSGNVGWSTGPHLHFVVYNQDIKERKTLETLFRIADGKEAKYLKEDEVYVRGYKG